MPLLVPPLSISCSCDWHSLLPFVIYGSFLIWMILQQIKIQGISSHKCILWMGTGRFHWILIGPAKSKLRTDSSFQSNTSINLMKRSQTNLTTVYNCEAAYFYSKNCWLFWKRPRSEDKHVTWARKDSDSRGSFLPSASTSPFIRYFSSPALFKYRFFLRTKTII